MSSSSPSYSSPDFAAGPSLPEPPTHKIQNPFDAYLSSATSSNMERPQREEEATLGFDPETYSYDEEMGAIYEQTTSVTRPLRTLSEEASDAATTQPSVRSTPRSAVVVENASSDCDDDDTDQLEARIRQAMPPFPTTDHPAPPPPVNASEGPSEESLLRFDAEISGDIDGTASSDLFQSASLQTSSSNEEAGHIILHPFSYASSDDGEHDAVFADTTDDEAPRTTMPPLTTRTSSAWNSATPAVGITALRHVSPQPPEEEIQKDMALAEEDTPLGDTPSSSYFDIPQREEEEDPPAPKRKFASSPRYYGCMIGIGLAFLIIGLVLLLYFLLDRPMDDGDRDAPPALPPAATPTPAPTLVPSNASISQLQRLLQTVSTDGGTALATPGTPQQRAFSWLAADPKVPVAPPERLVARYALATLYFSTNGASDDTNSSSSSWIQRDHWLSYEHHECEWFTRIRTGLCGPDQNRGWVPRDLDVSYNNLQGSLPPEIGLLSTLRLFRVEGGPDMALTGSLPSEMGQWTALEELRLPKNALTGRIPSTFGRFSLLHTFDLSGNQLRGLLPSELGQLSELQLFSVPQNGLQGPIPSALGQCSRLRNLNLAENQLSFLPKEIFQLSQLSLLDVQKNQLQGSLATQIGQISNITSLNLSRNRLEGALPDEVRALSILKELDLSHNEFNSTIPALWFGNLSNASNIFRSDASPPPLRVLRLNHNHLFGSIPDSLQYAFQNSTLQTLDLHANAGLTGAMPASVCDVVNVTRATVSVDCLAVSCPCCTQCCFPSEGEDVVCECRYWNTTLEWLCY